jgi:hypothetical protein
MRRRALVTLLAAGCVTGAAAASSPLLDIGDDVVVERAFVPSEKRPQGEVRLVRRGEHAVVQTVLYTRVLKRVLSTISGKERRNWPEGSAGHRDMEKYVTALEKYRQRATAARKDAGSGQEAESPQPEAAQDAAAREAIGPPAAAGGGESGSDRRRTMLIEFIDATPAPIVALGGVDLEEVGGRLEGGDRQVRVARRHDPVVLELGVDYVRRNMRLILADAFQISAEEAGRRLAQVAPSPK